jgi:hypothetical protein
MNKENREIDKNKIQEALLKINTVNADFLQNAKKIAGEMNKQTLGFIENLQDLDKQNLQRKSEICKPIVTQSELLMKKIEPVLCDMQKQLDKILEIVTELKQNK